MQKSKAKYSIYNKHWNYEQVKFLREAWGNTNIKTIAKKLNKTINAIKLKARRIGLKEWFYYNDYITLNQLYFALYKRSMDSYTINIWKRAGIPIKKIKKINDNYQMIDLDQFLKWFKKNLFLIDLSLTEKGDIVAVEPEWLTEKRKADKIFRDYRMRPWTESEDMKLRMLLKTYRYGYREISIKMKRTEGAIKRRMNDLKIIDRPLKAEVKQWTIEEINKVKELHYKGYKPTVIAEFVNHSSSSINGILERNKYFGLLPAKGGHKKNVTKKE